MRLRLASSAAMNAVDAFTIKKDNLRDKSGAERRRAYMHSAFTEATRALLFELFDNPTRSCRRELLPERNDRLHQKSKAASFVHGVIIVLAAFHRWRTIVYCFRKDA